MHDAEVGHLVGIYAGLARFDRRAPPRNAAFAVACVDAGTSSGRAVRRAELYYKFIVSACSSHDPRWVMCRCGRNGRCRKTRCFRRHKWRDVPRGGASIAHAPPPVAVLPGPSPPLEPHGQIGAQRAGATASPDGLGEPRARTGTRKEGTHCLSLVLVPWPRDYCIDCTIQ